jgi:hypothetical protein
MLSGRQPSQLRWAVPFLQTAHNEMEAENISKIRAIISIQNAWNAFIRSPAPLCIKVPPTYSFIIALSEMTMLNPVCNAYDPRIHIQSPTRYSLYLNSILSRAFHLKLSVSRLKFYYPGTMTDVWWSASIDLTADTLCWLRTSTILNNPASTTSIVLRYLWARSERLRARSTEQNL